MKNKLLNYILQITFALTLAIGCSTQQIKPTDASLKEGQWETKMKITDLKKDSSKIVGLDVAAIKNKSLRMNVTGPFGYPVADILLLNSHVIANIHTENKSYIGEATPIALKQSLKIDIDLKWFYSIFFREPLPGWNCNGSPRVEKCKLKDQFEITWSQPENQNLKISIKSPETEIQISVKEFNTKVQEPESVFKLEVPDSYQKIKLN